MDRSDVRVKYLRDLRPNGVAALGSFLILEAEQISIDSGIGIIFLYFPED